MVNHCRREAREQARRGIASKPWGPVLCVHQLISRRGDHE